MVTISTVNASHHSASAQDGILTGLIVCVVRLEKRLLVLSTFWLTKEDGCLTQLKPLQLTTSPYMSRISWGLPAPGVSIIISMHISFYVPQLIPGNSFIAWTDCITTCSLFKM